MHGLTTAQAKERLEKFGLNTIKNTSNSPLRVLINQFTNPLVFLLVFTVAISLFLGNTIDAIITTIIIVVNTLLGFTQEYKANEAYEKLKSLISENVLVLRDGEKKLIEKSLLVPDDIVFLKLGDIVPADCYVLEEDNLKVDESILTGESEDVYKTSLTKNKRSKENILYAGTHITDGTVTAKVFATGDKSEFGEIAAISINTKKPSEYEQNLKKLSRSFLIISILCLLFIFISHLIFNKHDSLATILLFTVAIAITIIPEALPVVSNLTLSKGALKLSEKKVIVKRAAAIEDLGNIDLICSDKTGTLTLNKLAVKSYHNEIERSDFLKYSYLSCHESSDPIDLCINDYLKVNLTNAKEFKPADFKNIPFDPIKKFSQRNFDGYNIIKGTPEYVFEVTKHNDPELKKLIVENAKEGLRSIAFAYQKGNDVPKYIGTYFLYDEIKRDADNVIKNAAKAGVQIKILTGDSKEVSLYVGLEVKLIKGEKEIIEAKNLHFDDPKILAEEVKQFTIFARCDPIQKFKIIEALQKSHFVGFLGDGINDAPSLKLANVGIVVNTASDIAKANADIILLSKSLEVIVDGIIEGRRTFENIDKYIKQTLVGNFGGFFTIGLISLFMDFLPMLPIQILISNLLTDIPSVAISADNVDREDIKKPKLHSINRIIKFGILFGLLSSLFDLIFFLTAKGSPGSIQTQWFAFSTFTELLVLLSLRTRHFIWGSKASKPSRLLIFAIILSAILTWGLSITGLGSEFSGISIDSIVFVVILSIAYFGVNEVIKLMVYKRKYN